MQTDTAPAPAHSVAHFGPLFAVRDRVHAGAHPLHAVLHSSLPWTGHTTALGHGIAVADTACAVCNVACTAELPVPAAQSLRPGVREQLAAFVQHPWNGHMVNTIFGNASYQLDSALVEMIGMRALHHVLAVAALLQRHLPRELRLHRYGIDDSLGVYVQVSHACLLEYGVERFFRDCAHVTPRTDELPNAVLLQIDDVTEFLRRAAARDLIAPTEATVPAELAGTLLSLQITKIGHIKSRMHWPAALPLALPTDPAEAETLLRDTEARITQLARRVTAVIRQLC